MTKYTNMDTLWGLPLVLKQMMLQKHIVAILTFRIPPLWPIFHWITRWLLKLQPQPQICRSFYDTFAQGGLTVCNWFGVLESDIILLANMLYQFTKKSSCFALKPKCLLLSYRRLYSIMCVDCYIKNTGTSFILKSWFTNNVLGWASIQTLNVWRFNATPVQRINKFHLNILWIDKPNSPWP